MSVVTWSALLFLLLHLLDPDTKLAKLSWSAISSIGACNHVGLEKEKSLF